MPLNPQVRAARDFLLQHRTDYDTAYQNFTWPELSDYNFAIDWFDGLAEENPNGIALWVIDSAGEQQRTSASWPTTPWPRLTCSPASGFAVVIDCL